MEKTDQEVAEEVVIRYMERSRDATDIQVTSRTDDEENWIFGINCLVPDYKSDKKVEKKYKVPLDKKSGLVGNPKEL